MLQWPRKVPDLACDESLFDKGSSNTITSALMRLFRLPRRRVLWFGASLAFLFLLYTLFLRVRPPHKHPGQHYYPQNDLYRESDVAVKLKSSHKQAEYIDKKGVHVVVGRYVGDSLHRDVPKFG